MQNHMNYAGEFNGRLDRDNLPSNIGITQNGNYEEPWVTRNLKLGCFHKIYSEAFDASPANRFFFREGYAGWASLQKDIDAKAGSTGRIGRINFTSEHEGLVVAHWTGWLVGEPEYGPASSASSSDNPDGLIDDLGADSLDIVELVMLIEKEFDIEIPDEDAEKISTVQDAADYINDHKASA